MPPRLPSAPKLTHLAAWNITRARVGDVHHVEERSVRAAKSNLASIVRVVECPRVSRIVLLHEELGRCSLRAYESVARRPAGERNPLVCDSGRRPVAFCQYMTPDRGNASTHDFACNW